MNLDDRDDRVDVGCHRQMTIVRWGLTFHLLFWWWLFAYYAWFWFPVMATSVVEMHVDVPAFCRPLYDWAATPVLEDIDYVAGPRRMTLWIIVPAGWISLFAVHLWGRSRTTLFLLIGSILSLTLMGLTFFAHWLVHYPALKVLDPRGG